MKKEKLFSNSFSTCKMSQKVSQNFAVFVPDKIPENPRMAPEKYGMYVLILFIFFKNR